MPPEETTRFSQAMRRHVERERDRGAVSSRLLPAVGVANDLSQKFLRKEQERTRRKLASSFEGKSSGRMKKGEGALPTGGDERVWPSVSIFLNRERSHSSGSQGDRSD